MIRDSNSGRNLRSRRSEWGTAIGCSTATQARSETSVPRAYARGYTTEHSSNAVAHCPPECSPARQQGDKTPACDTISPMPIDWFPLWLSLRVATISTVLALVIGLALAWLLANREFRGKEILDAAVTLPLVLPPTVLGYYLLVVLGRNSPVGKIYEWLFGEPLVFSWQAAVVAALFHSTPLLVKSARAAFESVDRSYERAARNLGASELRLFWRVTLPLARRSILAAAALAFARSLGDFGVTLMIAGNIPGRTQTVALAIFDAVEGGNGKAARVLVLIISGVALAVLSVANRLTSSPYGPRQTAL